MLRRIRRALSSDWGAAYITYYLFTAVGIGFQSRYLISHAKKNPWESTRNLHAHSPWEFSYPQQPCCTMLDTGSSSARTWQANTWWRLTTKWDMSSTISCTVISRLCIDREPTRVRCLHILTEFCAIITLRRRLVHCVSIELCHIWRVGSELHGHNYSIIFNVLNRYGFENVMRVQLWQNLHFSTSRLFGVIHGMTMASFCLQQSPPPCWR